MRDLPNPENVEMGDRLVVYTIPGRPVRIVPITEVRKDVLRVDYPDHSFSYIGYADSIVLKKDGRYLVGAAFNLTS